jgi:hypothetical protein
MTQHVLNLYQITNTKELSTRYRLIDVDGPFGDEDLADQNLSVLAKRIAFADAIPVAIVRSAEAPKLAVPADRELSRFEYQLTPDVALLKPRQETHGLQFDRLSSSDHAIAFSFLSFALRSPLRTAHDLWSPQAGTYLFRRPANYRNDRRDVDVFDGFSFRLLHSAGQFFLSVSQTVKYIANKWLTEQSNSSEMRLLKNKRFLYCFGNAWYPIQLLGLSGKAIGEQRFTPDGSTTPVTVLDYTRAKCAEQPPSWIQQLDPLSPAITYQNPGNEKKRYGAAALCRAMLTTDHPAVRALHGISIKAPEDRFLQSQRVVERYFSNSEFGNARVRISKTPLITTRRVFSVPALQFGQGMKLSVGNGKNAVPMVDLGKARMGMLLDVNGGMVEAGAMDSQYIILPESFHPYADKYRDRQEKTVRQFLHAPYQLSPVVYEDRNCRTLKSQVDSILDAIREAGVEGGHGILVLPAGAHPQLHNYIKRKLRHLLNVQCVDVSKLREFFEVVERRGVRSVSVPFHLEGKFASYLRYTALGLLLVNRQTPFCLASNRHFDLSIGLDVYRGTAAFTFVHGRGEKYYVKLESSQQKEKLLRQQIKDVLYRELRDCIAQGSWESRCERLLW